MRGLGKFLFGAAVGAGLMFGSLKYHIVRSGQGFTTVPKVSATFTDTYADVRSYTVSDWADHKALVAAILQAGKGDIIQDEAAGRVRAGVDGLMKELSRLTERNAPPVR